MARHRKLGRPLSPEGQAHVRCLIDQQGERQAARSLRIGDRTIVRAAAGFGVYEGTHAVVRESMRTGKRVA